MSKNSDFKAAFLIALLLFTVYLLTYSGILHSTDAFSALAVTENLVSGRAPDTRLAVWQQYGVEYAAGVQGVFTEDHQLHSKRGLLHSLLPAPLFALGGAFDAVMGRISTALLTTGIATALAGALVYLTGRKAGYKAAPAALGALAFGLATAAWPYARYLFGEPYIGLGLAMAAYGVGRAERGEDPAWLALAGAGLGLGAGFNLGSLAVAPVALWAAWHGNREQRFTRLTATVIPLAVVLALIGGFNMARFGSPLETGRTPGAGEWFSAPLAITLPAMALSPARGVLWYSPLIWLGLAWGARALIRRKPLHRYGWYIAATFVIYTVVYAAWYMWWGGYAWGPRFLVALSPLIALAALPAINQAYEKRGGWRAAVIAVVGAAMGVQLLGVAVDFGGHELMLTQRFGFADAQDLPYQYGLQPLYDIGLSPLVAHARRLLTEGANDISWFTAQGIDWAVLIPLGLFLALLGWLLNRTLAGGSLTVEPVVVLSVLAVGLSVWAMLRNAEHPLNAMYARHPDLDAVAAQAAPGDGAIIYVPELTFSILNHYPGFPPAWGMPPLVDPDPHLEAALTAAQREHDRLWVVSWFDRLDPNAWAEARLAEAHYALDVRRHRDDENSYWIGHYLMRRAIDEEDWQAVDWALPEGITLKEAAVSPAAPRPGTMLRVSLRWSAAEQVEGDYVIFVHVVDGEGRVVAQIDHAPQNTFRPTWNWEPGKTVTDQVALAAPSAPGDYAVRVGLYDWRKPAQPLEGTLADGQKTDRVRLP
ncbi:MAG: hypothetical protein JXB47_10385 [Anaerolineae bacterium]|nr:hypothetical protein [Anaerolineae bacterium]